MPLMPGRYNLTIFATVNGIIADWIKNAVTFDMEARDYFGSGKLPLHRQGTMLLEHQFIVGDKQATSKQAEPERRVPSRGFTS